MEVKAQELKQKAKDNLLLCLKLLDMKFECDDISFLESAIKWHIETAQHALNHIKDYQWADRIEQQVKERGE